MAEQMIPWREMIAVLHRRRRLILQVLVGGVATVAVGVWLQGPSYRTRATIMVTADRANVAVSPDAETGVTVARVTVEDLNSEVELLKSEGLVREVLDHHHDRLERDDTLFDRVVGTIRYPLTLPGALYRYIHDVPPPTALDYWVDKTTERLQVVPIVESNLIRVTYDGDAPEWGATLVNELIATHIERHTKRSQQPEAQRFYESQRQLLGEKSNDAEAALRAFYEREGMESMPEQQTVLRERLAALESALGDARTELAAGNARVAYSAQAIRGYPKHIPTESTDQSVALIKPRILELELQRSQLLTKYAPTSTVIQDIDRQIAEAKRLYETEKTTYAETKSALNPAYQALEVDLAQTRAQVAWAQARADALESQVGEYRAKIQHLEDIASEQKRLEQAVATAHEAFATYSKKQEEARFSSALDASSIVNLTIAEPAEVPTAPTTSQRRLTLALGAIMSLMAGVGLAFVRDRLDPAIKSATEAHSATGLPILAEVSS